MARGRFRNNRNRRNRGNGGAHSRSDSFRTDTSHSDSHRDRQYDRDPAHHRNTFPVENRGGAMFYLNRHNQRRYWNTDEPNSNSRSDEARNEEDHSDRRRDSLLERPRNEGFRFREDDLHGADLDREYNHDRNYDDREERHSDGRNHDRRTVYERYSDDWNFVDYDNDDRNYGDREYEEQTNENRNNGHRYDDEWDYGDWNYDNRNHDDWNQVDQNSENRDNANDDRNWRYEDNTIYNQNRDNRNSDDAGDSHQDRFERRTENRFDDRRNDGYGRREREPSYEPVDGENGRWNDIEHRADDDLWERDHQSVTEFGRSRSGSRITLRENERDDFQGDVHNGDVYRSESASPINNNHLLTEPLNHDNGILREISGNRSAGPSSSRMENQPDGFDVERDRNNGSTSSSSRSSSYSRKNPQRRHKNWRSKKAAAEEEHHSPLNLYETPTQLSEMEPRTAEQQRRFDAFMEKTTRDFARIMQEPVEEDDGIW